MITDEPSSDTSPAEAFFARLEAEPQPLLGGAHGTLRFDVTHEKTTTSWYVNIDHGDVSVSRSSEAADVSVTLDEALFDDVVTGRKNSVSAALRGELRIEGSPQLLNLFQRLFPGPPGGRST